MTRPRKPRKGEEKREESATDTSGTGKEDSARRRMAIFPTEFIEDLRYWVETDRKIALRLLSIVEAVLHDPFNGIGKPEPIKHDISNMRSRRLTQEHRVVYIVGDKHIQFIQARRHY